MSAPLSTGNPQGVGGAPAPEPAGAPSLPQAWAEAVDRLRGRLSAHTHKTYVAAARVQPPLDGEQNVLRLAYPSLFLATWVGDHYRETFESELLQLTNRRISVLLEERPADPEPVAEPAEAEPAPTTSAAAPVAATTATPAPEPEIVQGLHARYSFESFVVGGSNQFAFAAARAVAGAPGRTYNPLFLYGGSGLGKTHLMQATGREALRDNPSLRVVYTTSEQFTNDLIGSLQNRRMDDFRRRYREQCDLLLIDDVQFLAGRKATEEEFFHTFNALYSRGRQIIVTSDVPPQELDHMEERLRSRFQSGLPADIQPPELETRVAILKNKALAHSMALPDDVATYLATHIRSNVRELEGALLRISAFTSLTRGAVTVDVCKDILRNLLHHKGEPVDCDCIIKASAERFRVTVADIKGPVRKRNIARARQAAMWLCRRITKASYPELGDRFGGKDHSTVISAIQRVQQLMAEDTDFRATVEALERELSPTP